MEYIETLANDIASRLNSYKKFKGEVQARPCGGEYSTSETYEIYEGEKLLLSLGKRENEAVPHILDDRVKKIWPEVSKDLEFGLEEDEDASLGYKEEIFASRRFRGV